MYYRRKIILSLLELFDNRLSGTDFQKYLFLFSKLQDEPSFEFVPYKYGCFSFQSVADKSAMMKTGLLEESDLWIKKTGVRYLNQLRTSDYDLLSQTKNNYGNLKGQDLIRHVYQQYPYYAINSNIAQEILTEQEFKKVTDARPYKDEEILFTLGYEGKNIDQYLDILIRKAIRVVVDVRKNPLSMKYGFSKNQLKTTLSKFNIDYIHIPELGIESSKRQQLETYEDYQKLFNNYKKNLVPQKTDLLKLVKKILDDNHRIALICFESDYQYCHRSKITEALAPMYNYKIQINHI